MGSRALIIAVVIRIVGRSLSVRHVDATVAAYLGNILSVLLNIALAMAILSVFGVETTTFAALLAAAGVAIGIAWGGLFSSFAAGAFLIVLQPFRVGQFVTAGGVTGTVREIGLFVTAIDTLDNVRSIVPNSKVLSDTIQNFSNNPYRRVDCVAQLNDGVDHRDAAPDLVAAKEIPSRTPIPGARRRVSIVTSGLVLGDLSNRSQARRKEGRLHRAALQVALHFALHFRGGIPTPAR